MKANIKTKVSFLEEEKKKPLKLLSGGKKSQKRYQMKILKEARSWIGTPYQHQASLKGTGCDCLGLLRGIWRFLYGTEPEDMPAYSPDWAEIHGDETLQQAAERHLVPIDPESLDFGDVLLFRMRIYCPARHIAILSEPPLDKTAKQAERMGRMIHAYWGHAVTESIFSCNWKERLAYTYRFPWQNASTRM